jgi:hypothetical protein
MKRLLLLVFLFTLACFDSKTEQKDVYYIVVKLKETKEFSKYYYSTDLERSSGLLYERSFIDSSNKYFVGDTVIR